jgi:hypothetical protein
MTENFSKEDIAALDKAAAEQYTITPFEMVFMFENVRIPFYCR